MPEHALTATQLSHTYGEYPVIATTTFTLESGQISALTGPNGAGKSTLLLCLSGLLRPTTGSIQIEGFDLYEQEQEAKRHLAFVPDVPRFYQELTAWEHLQFMAMAFGAEQGFKERAEKLLCDFNLWEARDLYPHNYSRGMRLKLGILLALIRPFRVLLLDEPTSALDSESTDLLIDYLGDLRAKGASILFSTHSRELAQRIAERVYRLQNGELQESV